ncbi:MAG TPA: hypothetical protein VJM32_00450 [Candidatus Saccharimonadales bacterium]|nr:hypothetical protein [Candidatus Saccharimonadales bacterium]
MRITWKDGVTTLAAAGTVGLAQAHFNGFEIPLITDVRWVLLGISVLSVVEFVFGFIMDESHDTLWSAIASLLGVIMTGLTLAGLLTASSEFITMLALSTVVFWVISVLSHMRSTTHATHDHA